jgi:hypothetical protein
MTNDATSGGRDSRIAQALPTLVWLLAAAFAVGALIALA